MTSPVTAKETALMSPMPAIMQAWSSEPLTDHNTAPKAFQAGIGADPHIQYITDAWPGQGVPGDALLYAGSAEWHALAAGLKWHQNCIEWVGRAIHT